MDSSGLEVVQSVDHLDHVLPHLSNLLMQRQFPSSRVARACLKLDPLLLWGPTADLLMEDPVAPRLLQLLHLDIGRLGWVHTGYPISRPIFVL